MKALFHTWLVRSLALVLAASVTLAQNALAQDRVPFRDEELDQMLAPVALYPDPLLSQVLMASTYPLEVVQASRWSRANPRLKGQDAVRAVESQDWDPSVKSLTAFPQVLSMMDQKLEWTERVGEAFLAQPEDVMDSVQKLRRQAEIAGNLRSNEQMRVAREGEYLTIAPPAPEIVYVPYYDPRVVYGTWWYPAYPPVYWAPAPAYYVVPAHRPAFLWGSGIAISAGFFFGHTDWRHRHVTVHKHVNNVTVNRTTVINAPTNVTRTVWRHDPRHRRGVPFRNAEARQRFEQRTAATQASPSPRATSRPSAEARQRQMDERRKAADQRRDDRKSERRTERREPAPSQALAPNGNTPSAGRAPERPRQATRPEVRNAQPSGERRVERPEDAKGAERREAAPPRAAASGDGNARSPASRDSGKARPAPKAETRGLQPERPQQAERRDPPPQRAAPNQGNNRQPAIREADRPRPAARPDARNAQQPSRTQASAPRPTAERRVERREAPRPQARSVEPRPALARPAPRMEARGNGQARAAQPSPPRASPARAAPAPRAAGNQRANGRRGKDS